MPAKAGIQIFIAFLQGFLDATSRALRALAGMMAAFVVFYLQDFKTDVFKTLQILTFKNLSLCPFYSIK
jgi:hypothetical protein